ncbi:Alpha-mannosidase [Geobacillus proteiniphilus]|uniref:Alpha-mannosidase n=2 Tax=Geobacillus proteiniphilus TaxID=860353 RepID=A0A1Q5T3P9_9BACL|nr:Alpha-mannosidase [Geobacillus proteiniphilus]
MFISGWGSMHFDERVRLYADKLLFYNPMPTTTAAAFQWNKPFSGVFRANLNEEPLDSLAADECGTFAVEVKPNEVQTVLVVD